jgi:triacylglycerol lipase
MFLPPGFDRPTALEAVDLIGQAYGQFSSFVAGLPWNLSGNYDLLQVLSANPTGPFGQVEPFGFVARNRATRDLFVTFRGAVSLEDWLSSFTFPQVPHPMGGSVEAGFYQIYRQCSAELIQGVLGAGPAPNVTVTGHSLGGALATLAIRDLMAAGLTPQMYNFASPRVGDPAFAKIFNAQAPVVWRVVNTEDIVTNLPFATVVLSTSSVPRTALWSTLLVWHVCDYEHIGAPVSFTTQLGSIDLNHSLSTYASAL